jgi:hypothetical protein
VLFVELGDDDILDNLFNFCHIGIEIFLKSSPLVCEIQGDDRILPKPQIVSVEVKSDFSDDDIIRMRQRKAILHDSLVAKLFLAAQYLPLLGRVAAHVPVNYLVRFRFSNLISILLTASFLNMVESA